jgi:pentatricopeptide repeat protein
MDISLKIKRVFAIFKQSIRLKKKNLSESTYNDLVELLITNGYFDHASYLLCQMDRKKIKIPRNLLDLFLEYSIQNRIFEKKENNYNKYRNDKQGNNNNGNITKNQENNHFFNKYDNYDTQIDADFTYYFSRKNPSKKRDMVNIFSSLKIDSKPFFPKNVESKTSLKDIDTNKIKEFIPKGFKIEKKVEVKN